jgi:hypothetical protein
MGGIINACRVFKGEDGRGLLGEMGSDGRLIM